MSNEEEFKPRGEIHRKVDQHKSSNSEIEIDINFRIIEQFSSQLYDNPRRAIEELACNSYDAGANDCFISTPESESERLLVLDNGESMDLEGLEWLWRVAESRKASELDDDRIMNNRQQIGKFGVGKLAAFALGSRLTYVATKNNITRVISVDQDYLKDRNASEGLDFDVYELPTDEAEDLLSEFFDGVPSPWEEDWDTWTLASVGGIPPKNTGNELQPWNLKRMIRSSIPVSSRFQVHLNGEKIAQGERDDEPIVSLDVTSTEIIEEIQDNLRKFWDERLDIDDDQLDDYYDVSITEVNKAEDTNETVEAIDVPKLGPIYGSAEIYEEKLTKGKTERRGFKDHGFKIYVRGKLLNRNDPKYGIDEIPFLYWKNFIAELEIPALDDALLVQRDSTKNDTIEPEIARKCLHAIWNVSRRHREGLESGDADSENDYEPKSFTQRVGTSSPGQAYEAISGLSEGKKPVDIDSVEIEPRTHSISDEPVSFNSENNEIAVNEEHPLYQLLREENLQNNVRDTFSEVYASALLLVGYIRFNTDDQRSVDEAESLFDYALRSAAENFAREVTYLKNEIDQAIASDEKSLEDAIADTFRSIRFGEVNKAKKSQERYIELPISQRQNPCIAIRSVGSQGQFRPEKHDIKAMAPDPESKFSHALCVAHSFGEDSVEVDQVYNNCPENVSLLTIDSVKKMLELHYERRFTFSQIKDVLDHSAHPSSLEERVEDIWNQSPETGIIKAVLEAAYQIQKEREDVSPSYGALTVMPEMEDYDRSEIKATVDALSVLTDRVHVSTQSDEFSLLDSPSSILEELGNSIDLADLDTENHELSSFNSE